MTELISLHAIWRITGMTSVASNGVNDVEMSALSLIRKRAHGFPVEPLFSGDDDTWRLKTLMKNMSLQRLIIIVLAIWKSCDGTK